MTLGNFISVLDLEYNTGETEAEPLCYLTIESGEGNTIANKVFIDRDAQPARRFTWYRDNKARKVTRVYFKLDFDGRGEVIVTIV